MAPSTQAHSIRSLFSPPVFTDEKKSQQAFILHVLLLSLLVLGIFYLAFSLIFSPQTSVEDIEISTAGILVNAFLLVLLRRGHVRSASIIQVAVFWLLFTWISLTINGIVGPAYLMGYLLVILIAGILLGGKGALVMTCLSLAAGLGIYYLEKTAVLPMNSVIPLIGYWIISAFMFPLCSVLQYLAAFQMQQALTRASESEKKYHSILDAIQDVYYRCDLQGKLIMASPSFQSVFGYVSLDEVLGKSVAETFYSQPEKRQDFLRALDDQRQVRNFEEVLMRKDGSLFTASTSSHFTYDESGNITGIEGILRDITDWKKAEEQRMESEAAYRILFEESPFPISVTRLDSNHADANQAFCQFVGIPHSEIIGKTAVEIGLVDEEQNSHIQQAFEQAGRKLEQYEAIYQRKDGKFQYVGLSSKVVNIHGEAHVITICDDITKRIQTEMELKVNEERFRNISDAAFEGIMIHDKGIILDANRKFAEIFGYADPADIIGKNGLDFLLSPESSARVQARMMAQPGMVYDVVGVRKDGTTFQGETQSREMNYRGKKARVVTMRDITERIAAEAELRRVNRALRTISKCNESLVRSANEQELLQEICQNIVEEGEYQLACIDLVETDGQGGNRPGFSHCYALEESFQNEETSLSSGWEDVPGMVGRVTAGRQPFFINRLTEPYGDHQLGQFLKGNPYRSLAAIPLWYEDTIFGVLSIFSRMENAFDADEERLMTEMASDLSYGLLTHRARADRKTFLDILQVTNQELERSYDATLEGWSDALELRERETAGHSQRVVEMTLAIARAMNVPEAQLIHIRQGALLHDIGKMGIPDSILLKPGPLTDDEWRTMRHHPIYAHKLLKGITYLLPALDIPYCHHERWDGMGYPNKLAGERIPIAARIFAVVDVWDALTSDRPYRLAWSPEEALQYIRDQSGKQFDPQVVREFMRILEQNRNG
jgi:PAS domain S-box-containing protein